MAPVKRVDGPGEATAFVAGGGPATDDDVSITNDGRRLDSAEAVLEFLEELRREQEAAERLTEDVDVLPDDDEENLRRLAAALAELGAFLRVGGMSDDEARALPVKRHR